jgi:hypothetical protein
MFKDLITYIKYHKDINYFYNYSLKGKNGENVPEDYNWRQRLNYWRRAE